MDAQETPGGKTVDFPSKFEGKILLSTDISANVLSIIVIAIEFYSDETGFKGKGRDLFLEKNLEKLEDK